LLPVNGEGGLVAGAVANSNGLFTIRAPAGTYRMVGVKKGFIADFGNAPIVTVSSTLSNNVIIQPAGLSLSGRIVDAGNTNIGVPGVQLFVSSTNELFSVVYTETNGTFTVPVSASVWRIEPNERSLSQLGYVGPANEPVVNTATGSVSGLVIALPRANALVYGQVRNVEDAPIEDVEVSGDQDDLFRARALSDVGGRYALGITAGDWRIALDSYSLSAAGFLSSGTGTNISINQDQAIELDFVARPFSAWLAGQVVDDNANPVADLQLRVSDFTGSYSYTVTDPDGRFTVGVAAGSWYVQLETNDEEPALYAYPEMSFTVENGMTVFNINYRVLRATNGIGGTVRDEMGAPVGDVELYGWADIDGVRYRTSRGLTQPDGLYTMNVSTGAWSVGVECFRVEQRGYACPAQQTVAIVDPKTVIDFTLLRRSNDPSVLSMARLSTNGYFQFRLDGPSGWNYGIEVSDDLQNWSPLNTSLPNPPVNVIDPQTSNARRFYRAVRNPP
jgi:hypothetical protein